MAVGDMNDAVFAALQRYQTQVNPSVLAATDMGMSRTTLGQLLNPNIIAGTGVLAPETIQQLLGQRLESVESEAMLQAERDYLDALQKYDDELAAIQIRNMRTEPQLDSDAYQTTFERTNGDPVVLSLMNSLIGDDSQGITPVTLGVAKTSMGGDVDAQGWMNLGFDEATAIYFVQNGVNSIQEYMMNQLGFSDTEVTEFKNNTLNQINSDAGDYRNRYRKWSDSLEENQRKAEAELLALGDRPEVSQFAPYIDPEAERLKFFKDIGLEGLALLPDPMAQYRITRDDILAGMSDQTGRTAAEQALKRYQDASDPNVRTLASRPMRVGDPTSDYAMAEAGAVGAQAPTATRKDVARDVLSRLQAGRTEGGQAYREAQREKKRADLVADLLTRRLSAGGRTPFSDAMEQLYGYGSQV